MELFQGTYFVNSEIMMTSTSHDVNGKNVKNGNDFSVKT